MGSNYVDLSGVYRRIEDVKAEVRDAVRQITHEVNVLHQESMREIEYLQNQLEEMERNARLRDALQRALTEIIRVRQELENKFGSHKLVREYMLGILSATESGLVTKETISKCSEELMLSAPKYWLAPALIALAGWISDNKTLANRALAEAMKRDEEKTSLLFALITRRVNAGRISTGGKGTDVSFIWLNRYFSKQDPNDMKESVVAYLDAYTNGVFGEDVDRICSDHITKWMKELMEKNPDFEQEQKEYWINNFKGYCQDMSGEKFNALRQLSPTHYAQMNAYLSKINAAEREGGIRSYIGDIINQKVDKKALIDSIDEQLMKLVQQYEEGEEEDLRDEEQYLEFVKEFQGDEEKAKDRMEKIKSGRIDRHVSFVQRLNEAINKKDAFISAKKTAIYLLQGYINAAFEEFISVDKGLYPPEIDLTIEEKCRFTLTDLNKDTAKPRPFKWTGKTVNAENRAELVASLEKQYDDAKQSSLNKISDEKAKKLKDAGKILCFCVIGVVLFGFGLIMYFIGKGKLNKNDADRRTIKTYFDRQKGINVKLLNNALDAREEANQIVGEFDLIKQTQGAVVSI